MKRLSKLDRAFALLLSWAVPGSSAWALTPPATFTPAPASKPSTPVAPSGAADSADSSNEATSAAALATVPAPSHDDEAVRPILECVVRHSSTSYTAYFGYNNENDQTVSIPIGSKNSFSPSPQNRSQPTSFAKGRSPFYPNAAFSVAFNGSNLTWSLRGPDNDTRSVTASSSSPQCQAAPTPTPTATPTPTPIPTPTPPHSCAVTVFGPTRFTRSCDDNGPTVYNQTFTTPAGSAGPYTLKVVNGDAQGNNKTTSAEVKINGVEVVKESDFSNNVVTFTKTVATLQASNALYVRVKGSPGSTFTLQICQSGGTDTVPPTVQWLSPGAGEITKDSTPSVRVTYSDAVSAPNLATLKITIDDVDRTSSFVRTASEASFEIAPALSDGTHTLHAEIKDQPGNLGSATRTFRVDATAPSLTVQAPAPGLITNDARPSMTFAYVDSGTDPSLISPSTFRVTIGGVDVTSGFTANGSAASGRPPAALASGPHTVTATIADVAGNVSTVSRDFIVDTNAPVIVPVAPAQGQIVGAGPVVVGVTYSDVNSVDPSSFTARLDGTPVTLTADVDHASGTITNPGAGPHSLVFSVKDGVGNTGSLTVNFTVDVAAPEILITSPLNGIPTNGVDVVSVSYSDAVRGVSTSTFKLTVDGVDRTSAFTIAPNGATGVVAPPLGEGSHTVVAEIRNTLGNLGTATSSFVVDLTPPVVTADVPSANGYVRDANELRVVLADALSGIEPTATTITIDGLNVTSDFNLTSSAAIAKVSAASLEEGVHSLSVLAIDRAGNPTTFTLPFRVDRTAPIIEFLKPGVDGATNASSTEIWFRPTDPQISTVLSGSGVDELSIQVFLGEEGPGGTDLDISALFTPVDNDIRGVAAPPLADGFHTLKFAVRDRAGNQANRSGIFLVDTIAPTASIDTPVADAKLKTANVVIELRYSDDGSHVNEALTQLYVDGVERPADHKALRSDGESLTVNALSEGLHTVKLRVLDRAGNTTDVGPISVTVDTVAPTAEVVAPGSGAFVGSATPQFHLRIADTAPSSGLYREFTSILLDGIEIKSSLQFASTGGGATPALLDITGPAPVLTDGPHTIRIAAVDGANNPVELLSQFVVDLGAPDVTPSIPEGGQTVGGGAISPGNTTVITGTINDSDPNLTVTCSAGSQTVNATITGNTYSCVVPVAEGANQITVTVTDSTGHTTTATGVLTVDRMTPEIAIVLPADGDATSAEFINVTGWVRDATAVSVTVNGVVAQVAAGAPGTQIGFSAANVPVGAGDSVVLLARATDGGGNFTTASRTVVIDRADPVVTITKPAPDIYIQPGTVRVEVDVLDRTSVLLEVNGVPGANPVCAPQPSGLSLCHYRLDVALVTDGNLVATAVDAAGHVGTATLHANIDSTSPSLTIVSPVALSVTKDTTLHLSGRVTDSSDVTLKVNGQTLTVDADGFFDTTIPAGPEGERELVFLATDLAGNKTTEPVTVTIDRTAPTLAIVTPAANAVISTDSLTVAGTVNDATHTEVTVQGAAATTLNHAFTSTFDVGADGPLTITVRATDAAGNESVQTRVVEIDRNPPSVTITSPASGTLTKQSVALVGFTVLDRSITTITVNGQPAPPVCPGGNPCERTHSVTLVEGENTITVEATDAGGQSFGASVVISMDSIAPVVDVQAPESVTRGETASVTVSASDDGGVEHIELKAGSTVVCTGTASCTGVIPIPESGSATSITLTAIATDRAGNATTTTRTVEIASGGVVTGIVLDDATSLPLAGATVTLIGPGGRSVTTNDIGRYSLEANGANAVLHIEKAGMTAVDRFAVVNAGTGSIAVDARLTRIADVTASNPHRAGPFSIQLPSGTNRVTRLSPQGLPNLLPYGFSPLAALQWDGPVATASVAVAPSNDIAALNIVLVRYDAALRDWRVVASQLPTSAGAIAVDLPAPGSYAFVTPDVVEPAIVVGPAGDPLAGLAPAAIPVEATSSSQVDPAVLPPTGGTATGSLRIDSPATLPSGTIVQAEVEEFYTLASNEQASSPKRAIDIIAFKRTALATSWDTSTTPALPTGATSSTSCAAAGAPTADQHHICAAFPITPSRSYANSGLKDGRVHLDLLSGREYARGVIGGNLAATITSGKAQLSVAAGSASENAAVSMRTYDAFSPFIPNTATITPLAEVSVDFGGVALTTSASLKLSEVAAAPGDTLVLARVDRASSDGIPRLQVVALADVTTANGVTSATTRLQGGTPAATFEGIRQEGRYVLLKVATPIAFAIGRTTASGSPVRATVTSSASVLPFIATANGSGDYTIVIAATTVTLTAKVAGAGLEATAIVAPTVGSTVTANIVLQGITSPLSVTPAPGAIDVPVNEPLTATSPVAINPGTVTTENIKLKRALAECSVTTPAPALALRCEVPLRFVLSGSGRSLSIIPNYPPPAPGETPRPPLEFQSDYVLTITGLTGMNGAVITAPVVNFRTAPLERKVINTAAVKFSLPNASGRVTVSAPAGGLEPGTTVLIINSGNGVVASFTAGNDGSLSGTLEASIDDLLFVTITDPSGEVTTLEVNQFVDPVTGETAVGAFGGRVAGPQGSALEIPRDALSRGTKFKLDYLTNETLQQTYPGQLPDLGVDENGQAIGQIGGALRVEVTEGQVKANKEMDLVFPIPSNLPTGVDPRTVTYYVFQRVEGPCENGAPTCAPHERQYILRTVDEAVAECEDGRSTCDVSKLRVRTASFPFIGFLSSLGFGSPGVFFPTTVSVNVLAFEVNQLEPGQSRVGVITGYVYDQVVTYDAQGQSVAFKPVVGAAVGVHAESSGSTSAAAFKNGSQSIAVTDARGRYSLFHQNYKGGIL